MYKTTYTNTNSTTTPLTIKYCQDDLRTFRVSIALNRFPDQTPHSSWYEEAEKHIPRHATTTNKHPKLNSATDPGLRSATPMLTQRQQHTCTRRAVINFSIGGREAIRQYVIVRGGSNNDKHRI